MHEDEEGKRRSSLEMSILVIFLKTWEEIDWQQFDLAGCH